MNVTKRTTSRTLALLLLLLLLAGCGGQKQDPLAQSLANSSDQIDVEQAAANLDRAAIAGDDLPSKTLALVRAIRRARDDGVSNSWIDKRIDDSESVIVDLCESCYSMLEGVR
jgi:uncharacterized Ntn-hydrolase superfamily protein